MAKKTIDQIEVSGKSVLTRVDFNVPLEDGQITDDRRIRAACATIKSICDRGGRAVLIAHLGRPAGEGYEKDYSLQVCAERLSELLSKPVQFPSQDCVDETAAEAVNAMSDGDVVLLENLRFHKDEKRGDAEFAAKLGSYGDIYCNDAFGTSHRSDASMVLTPKSMAGKPRVAGFLIKQELMFLSERLESPERPYVAVLGGAKVSDKIGAVERLIPKTDAVLIGGAMAYTFLAAMGIEVGASRVERDRIADAKRMIELAAIESCDLHLPKDHVCSTEFAERAGDIETFDGAIQAGYMGLDIGPKTQGEFCRVISRARTIVWNGPMGVFEWIPFSIGTQQVADAMAEATEKGAISVVGGGDSAAAAAKFNVEHRLTHVSTGGGASLAILAGDPMPALDVLDEG